MPEKTIKKRGGAKRWRNKPIKGHPGSYLKCAIVRKPGKRGGHTVCTKKRKKGGK